MKTMVYVGKDTGLNFDMGYFPNHAPTLLTLRILDFEHEAFVSIFCISIWKLALELFWIRW